MSNIDPTKITVTGQEAYFNEDVTFWKDVTVHGTLKDSDGNTIGSGGGNGVVGS